MNEVIQHNWLAHLNNELIGTNRVRIISPFITDNIVRHLLETFEGDEIQVITRYNLNDFRSRVSSLSALRRLVEAGAMIKSVKKLHSKLYLFDTKSTIVTSANFTNGGFFKNKELGIKSTEIETIAESNRYFDSLWAIDPEFLDADKINTWQNEIDASRGSGPSIPDLPDYGKSYEEKVTRGRKYFVKFFGTNQHRVGLDFESRTEIENALCHYALSFSRKNDDRRPRKYRDGDVVFMAMMLHGNDYAIFGKGISYSHNDERDVATTEDIRHVPWRDEWPILIRVHSTEFIDSNMGNCPKLMDLIHDLDYESFQSTLRRYNQGEEEIIPRKSLMQKADIELSELGAIWVEEKFEQAIKNQGKVPAEFINQFYQGSEIV